MLLIKMMLSATFKAPLNKWDKGSIRPGPVGSVGDALTSVRIKQSSPDMPFAYDKTFNPDNDVLRGSNVQDGQWFSFSDHGYGAQVKRKKLNKNGSFKHSIGWMEQNIVPEARSTEPKVLDQPLQGWNTQVGEILQRQGDMFSDLPGGYGPTSMTRGGAFPSIQTSLKTKIPETKQIVSSVVQNSSVERVSDEMQVDTPTNSVVVRESVMDVDTPTPVAKSRNSFGLKLNTIPPPPPMPMTSQSSGNPLMDEIKKGVSLKKASPTQPQSSANPLMDAIKKGVSLKRANPIVTYVKENDDLLSYALANRRQRMV